MMEKHNIFPEVKDVQPVTNHTHFVPAYVMEIPDLTLQTTVQNLLWFAVECLNSLPSISKNNERLCTYFSQTVTHLEHTMPDCAANLDEHMYKQIVVFLHEAQTAETLITNIFNNKNIQPISTQLSFPVSATSEIAAKATYLNWLAICICEELKLPSDFPH